MLEPSRQSDSAVAAAVQMANHGPPARSRAVMFPALYTWYVFLSALDLMLTWIILHADGEELNLIAAWVIARYNIRGLIAFKFIIVALVLLACEVVGRLKTDQGAKLARWAVALSAFPVVVGAAHLLLLSLELRAPLP